MNEHASKTFTTGSLFAGIGAFDYGFEQAGAHTAWQVEINAVNRIVLGDRFPRSRQFEDVRTVTAADLGPVDCILAGFPCQDISNSGASAGGARPGLSGARSGLFFEVIRLLRELQPQWCVLENVAALLSTNDCKDFETVIRSLADCGYMGCFRVLDAAHFGSPCRRRRVFLVGRLGRLPPTDILSDAGAVEGIPSAFSTQSELQTAVSWPGYTLQASNTAARITMGSELLIAEEDGWHQMGHREREIKDHGTPCGMDGFAHAEVYGAGNAVAAQCATWLAKKIVKAHRQN